MLEALPAELDLFTDNHRWGDLRSWNETAAELHRRGGIHRVEHPDYAPFWVVIDYDALYEIERNHAVFRNEPDPVLLDKRTIEERGGGLRTLIHLDDPLHGKLRRLTADWFKPKSIRRMDARLDELSLEAVGKLEAAGGSCDFATEIALPYPLQVILGLLGLPTEDYPRMLKLTQELFGQEDPDLQRDAPDPEVVRQVIQDFYSYFAKVTADRRANPTDDLASLIANGTLDGEPIGDLETMGYYVIIATAGHDTTSSAMAGGLEALIANPDQLRKLQADPSLLPNAVEEVIRWTSPVRHFMRTASEDTEVLGQPIRKGDWLYLSYKAANLDPKVFTDPLRFDIERENANRQIAFGQGVHFCLGATLARNELQSLYGRILPRLASIEFDGPPQTMKTTFVGGHKRLPIRYELRDPG